MDIVLLEPENEGNVGAIARAMKNFGFSDLVIINPKCEHLSDTAKCRAKHAVDVLENARVLQSLSKLFESYDYVIGTTAKLGSDYNLPRSPLLPRELALKINKLSKKSKIALVFGRESLGLLNEELEKCDFVVHIPASEEYPTLNLSHAATILFYELSQKENSTKIDKTFVAADKKEKELLLEHINRILDNMSFRKPEEKETQQLVWKRLFGKSFLTKREAFALFGFFRKIK